VVAGSWIGAVRQMYANASLFEAPYGTQANAGNNGGVNAVAPDSGSWYWNKTPAVFSSNGLFMSRNGGGFSLTDEVLFSSSSLQESQAIDLVYDGYDTSLVPFSVSFGATYRNQSGTDLLWWNSRLWVVPVGSTLSTQSGWNITHRGVAVWSVDGHNMFSRTRLDSPVTKSATETMKITYQLTLPADPWRIAATTHDAPW